MDLQYLLPNISNNKPDTLCDLKVIPNFNDQLNTLYDLEIMPNNNNKPNALYGLAAIYELISKLSCNKIFRQCKLTITQVFVCLAS